MAAIQRERVPSLRGYRDFLSAEDRQMYDEKLTYTAGIDPYALVQAFSWLWRITHHLLFKHSRGAKEPETNTKHMELVNGTRISIRNVLTGKTGLPF